MAKAQAFGDKVRGKVRTHKKMVRYILPMKKDIRTGITDLLSGGIEKTDVDKGVIHLEQVLQIASHVFRRGRQSEIFAVEQIEDIDHSFLQEKVYRVALVVVLNRVPSTAAQIWRGRNGP